MWEIVYKQTPAPKYMDRLDVHDVMAMVLHKFHFDPNFSIPRLKEQLQNITLNTRTSYDAILVAMNFIYKLIHANQQLEWSPLAVYAVALWMACEVVENNRIAIQVWHERTQVPLRELKLVENVFRGSLGHQLYITSSEMDQFKLQFSKFLI